MECFHVSWSLWATVLVAQQSITNLPKLLSFYWLPANYLQLDYNMLAWECKKQMGKAQANRMSRLLTSSYSASAECVISKN